MTQRVRVEVSDQIALVTLNRPEKMNALDPEMFEAINATIDQLADRNDVRVVVLQG